MIIIIQDHIFEIYTIVSEIHDNVDLVLRVKSLVQLEVEMNLGDLTFKLLIGQSLFFL